MKKILLKTILFSLITFGTAHAEKKAPDFKLSGLNSDSIQLSDYKGKVVYLDFWATWCVPCRKSFPWMNAMLEKYQNQGLEVIAISLDDKKKMVETFLKKYPAKFTIALDPKGETGDLYKVRVMPSSYLIDGQGNIIDEHMGFRNKDKNKLEEMLQTALSTLK